jgi:hypothetical protein
MNVSPSTQTCQYEIWLFYPEQEPRPFQECGYFESRRDAIETRNALVDWLTLSVWLMPLDRLPPRDQRDVFRFRQGVKADGYSLTQIELRVRRVRELDTDKGPVTATRLLGDPSEEDDFEDLEDTVLDPGISEVNYTQVDSSPHSAEERKQDT